MGIIGLAAVAFGSLVSEGDQEAVARIRQSARFSPPRIWCLPRPATDSLPVSSVQYWQYFCERQS